MERETEKGIDIAEEWVMWIEPEIKRQGITGVGERVHLIQQEKVERLYQGGEGVRENRRSKRT